MSERRMTDNDWDLLPQGVASAVRSWCIKNNFVGDDGHISYVYANCALVAIDAAAEGRFKDQMTLAERYGEITIK